MRPNAWNGFQALRRDLAHIRVVIRQPGLQPRLRRRIPGQPQIVAGIRPNPRIVMLRQFAQAWQQRAQGVGAGKIFQQHAGTQPHIQTGVDVADDGQHGGQQFRVSFDQRLGAG